MVSGRNNAISGKASRMTRQIAMAIQNGMMPAKISFSGTSSAMPFTTKTFTPTGIDFMDPDDMTGTAVFLATEDSRMIHGETIIVDVKHHVTGMSAI